MSEVNGSVTAINEATQSLIEAAKNMQVQISYQSKLQQVTVKVLSDFLCQEIAIFNTEQLTDKERTNIMASLSYMNDRLLQALDISKYNEINASKEPVNTTGFIGTGNILGGTTTSSRLVEKTTD